MTITSTGLLTKARDLIRDTGWTQGISIDVDAAGKPTAYCALGAIGSAYYDEISISSLAGYEDVEIRHRAYGKALDRLRDQIPAPFDLIPYWNDFEGRTKDEVLAVFERAIEA